MTTNVNNSISSSCQSIISASLSAGGGIGGVGGTGIRTGQYINGTGSLGRLKYHKSLDASDEELEYSQLSQSTHIIGRVRSERFLACKPDEDRRRRTIIVEKKKDSFGFTLQSYGIHYKKDEEIEMITYVDYVEYDGPAYKSGMREGDVILSINGADMEKADHKTLVDFIKSCDTRMRMVVQFEDCVRKVDLHMRYMQLQGMLQSKMNELERICLRERELLEGRWKTHSLPARKKATTSPTDTDLGGGTSAPVNVDMSYYRPTLSTEDVGNTARNHHSMQAIIPPPAQFMLSYHYLEPNYRYILKPTSSNNSGEYFVAIGNGIRRSPSDHHVVLSRTGSVDTTTHAANSQQRKSSTGQTPPAPPPRTCEKHKPPNKQNQHQQHSQHQQQQQQQSTNQESTQPKAQKSSKHSCHGHSCNPCIGHFRWKSAEKAAATAAASGNNGDNVSLDAYDLASPCCDAHCVPTRRRARHHKEHAHKHKHRDRDRDATKQRAVSAHGNPEHNTATQQGTSGHHVGHHHHHHHQAGVTQTTDSKQHHQHYQHRVGNGQTSATQHYYAHHHHQPQQQQTQKQQQQQQQVPRSCDSQNGSIRSRYFDLTGGMASHCSLHSCASSEIAAADNTSYATSLSTDTLYWDPKSDTAQTSRHQSIKSRQSYQQQPQQQQPQQQPQLQQSQQQHQPQQQQQQQKHQQQQPPHQIHGIYQQRYHITATQIQPSQVYPNATAYVHKPKSWDNLTTKSIGGYGFGYGYLDTVTVKPTVKLQIAQQRHSMPRKNPYGRFSTYTDVENYAPPPSQFVEELTTTTTTTITAKSTEELIACDCLSKQQQQQQQQAIKLAQMQIGQNRQLSHQTSCQMGGYYSHLPRPTADAATSTVSEVTRL